MQNAVDRHLPMLELDVLRTLIAIAETGSFAGAAESVHRTPSAVSMQIKKLEQTLGRPMFVREARKVTLTSEGEIVLSYARRMLSLARELVAKFVEPDLSGIVRVGAPDDFGEQMLPALLTQLAASHPQLTVDVVIDHSTDLEKRFAADQLDVCLVSCNPSNVPEDAEVVISGDLVWAGAKGGRAHLCRPLPISVWEQSCAWRTHAVHSLEKAGIEYRVAYMSGHIAAQRAAILSDLAIAPIPQSYAHGEFAVLGERHGLPPAGKYALGMKIGVNNNPAVCSVADHIRNYFCNLGHLPAQNLPSEPDLQLA